MCHFPIAMFKLPEGDHHLLPRGSASALFFMFLTTEWPWTLSRLSWLMEIPIVDRLWPILHINVYIIYIYIIYIYYIYILRILYIYTYYTYIIYVYNILSYNHLRSVTNRVCLLFSGHVADPFWPFSTLPQAGSQSPLTTTDPSKKSPVADAIARHCSWEMMVKSRLDFRRSG